MSKIIIYHKPTCSTSRKAFKLLQEKNIEFRTVKYYEEKFTKSKLKSLLKKMKLEPAELLRKKENAYKELDFKNNKYKKDEIIDFMVSNPDLIERPIIETSEIALLGRPLENLEEFLNKNKF